MLICDIYPYLYTYLEMLDYVRLEKDRLDKYIFHFLNKINVELPENQTVKSSSKVKFKLMYKNKEDIGEKVSRNLFNQKIKKKQNDDFKSQNCLLSNNSIDKSDHYFDDKPDNSNDKFNNFNDKSAPKSSNKKKDLVENLIANEFDESQSIGSKIKITKKKEPFKNKAIEKVAIKKLIREFKRKELLKKMKRRKLIRKEFSEFKIE